MEKEDLVNKAVNESRDLIIAQIKQQTSEIISKQAEQIRSLTMQLEKQGQDIDFLTKREVDRPVAEEQLKLKREQRAKRTKAPARDCATFPEFQSAMRIVNRIKSYKSDYAQARDKISLLLLFLTGIRGGELDFVTASTLEGIQHRNEVKIVQNKTRSTKVHTYTMTPLKNSLARQFSDEIDMLCEGKEPHERVITAKGSLEPLERTWASKRINGILKLVSKEMKKHITMHSFRIGEIDCVTKVNDLATAST